MRDAYAMRMAMVVKPALFACLTALALGSGAVLYAHGAQDYGQEAATQRRQSGQIIPVRALEQRVIPMMQGAQYLGFDFDPSTDIYTFKFKRNVSVIWVDVDGRTGRILRRTGN